MRRFENGLDGSEVVPLQVRLEEGDRRGLGDSIEEVLERVNLTTCTLQTFEDRYFEPKIRITRSER